MFSDSAWLSFGSVKLEDTFPVEIQRKSTVESAKNSIKTYFNPLCSTGLWQMFRTFVLRCDWSILRILKSIKKHERQSERVTIVSIHNNIFRLYLS